MKRRPRDPLPSPAELEADVRALIVDAMAVRLLYRRAYEYGLEPGRRGDGIPVTGGDPSNVPLEMLDNARARAFRNLSRSVARQVKDAENALGNARSSLRENVEPGYVQPPRDRSLAVVTATDFQLALERKTDRGRRGVE